MSFIIPDSYNDSTLDPAQFLLAVTYAPEYMPLELRLTAWRGYKSTLRVPTEESIKEARQEVVRLVNWMQRHDHRLSR
jgi:hypothetical protein